LAELKRITVDPVSASRLLPSFIGELHSPSRRGPVKQQDERSHELQPYKAVSKHIGSQAIARTS